MANNDFWVKTIFFVLIVCIDWQMLFVNGKWGAIIARWIGDSFILEWLTLICPLPWQADRSLWKISRWKKKFPVLKSVRRTWISEQIRLKRAVSWSERRFRTWSLSMRNFRLKFMLWILQHEHYRHSSPHRASLHRKVYSVDVVAERLLQL